MSDDDTEAAWQMLRDLIGQCGGLVRPTDIAERWGISRQRVRQIVTEDVGFPEPAVHHPHASPPVKLYIGDEVDEWFAKRRGAAQR